MQTKITSKILSTDDELDGSLQQDEDEATTLTPTTLSEGGCSHSSSWKISPDLFEENINFIPQKRSAYIFDSKGPKTKRRQLKPGPTAKNFQRHFANHEYHDYSQDSPEVFASRLVTKTDEISENQPHKPNIDIEITSKEEAIPSIMANHMEGSTNNKTTRGPRGGVAVPFPKRLYEMLMGVEVDGLSHIVSWQPHGRCFIVRQPKDFVEVILPQYFRQTKFTSFQRQLNLYGFTRLTSGTDKGGYYHELFLRGKPFLFQNMVRIRIKGTGIKAVSSPESEPNFYEMPPILPDENFDSNALDESIKVTGIKAVSSPESEPNFYEMPPILPDENFDSNALNESKHVITHGIAPIEKASCFGNSSPSIPIYRQVNLDSKIIQDESFPKCIVSDSQEEFQFGGAPIKTPLITQTAVVGAQPDLIRRNSVVGPKKDDEENEKNTFHSNDAIIFEGKKFYYLESFTLESIEKISQGKRNGDCFVEKEANVSDDHVTCYQNDHNNPMKNERDISSTPSSSGASLYVSHQDSEDQTSMRNTWPFDEIGDEVVGLPIDLNADYFSIRRPFPL